MNARDVWITGIGLLTPLGEGNEEHRACLRNTADPARLDAASYAPYPIHTLGEVDFSRQIPKKADQRQMELWQRIGVYASGLALADSGLAHDHELLARTNLNVAAGSGERDTAVDAKILETIGSSGETELLAKEILPTALRPTLFLAQLSNLLAGNISIVHNVTASSRTFMGEEIAGLAAVENACRRIQAGQGDVFLVGGALNANREDLLLGYELGKNLWAHPYKGVWSRKEKGGGFIPGSAGAFLVLEAREHAQARGRKAYAQIRHVATDCSRRRPGDTTKTLAGLFDTMNVPDGPLAVMSGASGVEPVTADELAFLQALEGRGHQVAICAYGTRIGHSVEAHFPAGVALAALALTQGEFFAPSDENGVEAPFKGDELSRVLVTGAGHWRGEGLALLERVEQ
ncbi:MAG TPA: beta-ketoacyl-ACP synthase [Hyphomicrobium sp.]|nr:beta-ketoacyl-ACP synthase [Hyphomicrobium sp.]